MDDFDTIVADIHIDWAGSQDWAELEVLNRGYRALLETDFHGYERDMAIVRAIRALPRPEVK